MAYKLSLTGRRRHRAKKRLFGPALLVLQVEVLEKGEDWALSSLACRPYENTFWRDATAEDLTVEGDA